MIDHFDHYVTECSISFEHTAKVGSYAVYLEFYKDAALTDWYKTIVVTEDNKNRWYVGGSLATIVYNSSGDPIGIKFTYGGEVRLSYVPDKDDKIFDMVLYVKLTTTGVVGT